MVLSSISVGCDPQPIVRPPADSRMSVSLQGFFRSLEPVFPTIRNLSSRVDAGNNCNAWVTKPLKLKLDLKYTDLIRLSFD